MRFIPACMFLLASVVAPCAVAEEFPEGAKPLAPTDLSQRLSGKVFTVALKDGAGWKFDYRSNGYFYFNHSAGPSDSGEWKVEESRLCMKGRRIVTSSCNEVREKDGSLLYQRDNGDVVTFVEKR